MMLDERSKSLLRVLIYPVQFDRDPKDGVERVLEQVVNARACGATPGEFLAAIRAALQSPDKLSDLIPIQHDETAIRSFLGAIEDRMPGLPPGAPARKPAP